jgi:hypothetical protein
MLRCLLEERYDLHCSPNTLLVIKLRRMRWVEHVARMGGEKKYVQGFGEETWDVKPLGKHTRKGE